MYIIQNSVFNKKVSLVMQEQQKESKLEKMSTIDQSRGRLLMVPSATFIKNYQFVHKLDSILEVTH